MVIDMNEEKEKQRMRLKYFLKSLSTASQLFGLCLQWTKDGIEVQEVDAGDGDPGDLRYTCVTQDGGYEHPTVAKDLIYDD